MIRSKFGAGVIRCSLNAHEDGTAELVEQGPVYEIDAENNVWTWRIDVGDWGSTLIVEVDRFRQLLRDLGVTITLFWKPDGRGHFVLDYGRLQITLGENVSNDHSSRCSRARSRGKG